LGLLHRIATELISALGMGTNLDVAAADQSRPSATTTARPIHPMRRIFIPHLSKTGVAYFSPFECEVAHTSRGINGGSGGHRPPTASRRPSRGRWRAILVASHPSEMLSSHVLLLTLDVGLHVSRRHQPHRMAECLELARPVVRRGASLDPNQTYWQFLEERQEAAP